MWLSFKIYSLISFHLLNRRCVHVTHAVQNSLKLAWRQTFSTNTMTLSLESSYGWNNFWPKKTVDHTTCHHRLHHILSWIKCTNIFDSWIRTLEWISSHNFNVWYICCWKISTLHCNQQLCCAFSHKITAHNQYRFIIRWIRQPIHNRKSNSEQKHRRKKKTARFCTCLFICFRLECVEVVDISCLDVLLYSSDSHQKQFQD